MNVVFITGNGFDLDLGLNTSFKAFIKSFEFATIADLSLIEKIKNNKDNELWCDIEGVFRKVLLNNEYRFNDEDINLAWQGITEYWEKYLQNVTRKDHLKIRKDSCAYAVLKQMSPNRRWYSFNYTSPFYLTDLSKTEPIYVHNQIIPMESYSEVHIITKRTIIGVDSNLPKSIIENKELSHIIKKNHPFYENTYITDELIESEYIIIFGHSLGITDSDYFKPLFEDILNSTVKSKYIYLTTYDNNSLEDIKLHLKEYDIDYNELCKKSYLRTVFTSEGANNTEFKEVLELLRS